MRQKADTGRVRNCGHGGRPGLRSKYWWYAVVVGIGFRVHDQQVKSEAAQAHTGPYATGMNAWPVQAYEVASPFYTHQCEELPRCRGLTKGAGPMCGGHERLHEHTHVKLMISGIDAVCFKPSGRSCMPDREHLSMSLSLFPKTKTRDL